MLYNTNNFRKHLMLFIILLLVIITISSCEKEIKTYRFTDEERKLMLFEIGDTIKLSDNKKTKHLFYVNNNKDSSIEEHDFLGKTQYKFEILIVEFSYLNGDYAGNIRATKANRVFDYYIEIELPESSFKIFHQKNMDTYDTMQMLDYMNINGINYHNIYVFNNTILNEKDKATQKIYLNTEYGFLKLEDLEKDVVYTIVRE